MSEKEEQLEGTLEKMEMTEDIEISEVGEAQAISEEEPAQKDTVPKESSEWEEDEEPKVASQKEESSDFEEEPAEAANFH
jgi:hypothetical protein